MAPFFGTFPPSIPFLVEPPRVKRILLGPFSPVIVPFKPLPVFSLAWSDAEDGVGLYPVK